MPKKPENLLNELESISSLLNDNEDNIPILQEAVDDVDDKSSTDADNLGTAVNSAATQTQRTPQNRQTIKPKETRRESATTRKKGTGDNPFLPQHIRTRLKEGKESFMKEQLSQPGNPYEPIIDELVAYYLPQIEKDLRERLKVMATSFATTHYDENDIDNLINPK